MAFSEALLWEKFLTLIDKKNYVWVFNLKEVTSNVTPPLKGIVSIDDDY